MFRHLRTKASEVSRANKLDHFYSLCSGGRILDVGVSATARVASENIFLSTFRFPGSSYVGLGVEDLTELAHLHPDKRFVTYDGRVFPFADDEFDWAFSNAVIEHVGAPPQQIFFLNEMLRVAKNVFFTTPNKYFPVESHTNAFFVHWAPGDLFYRWCAKHRPHWSKKNLQLLSHRDLLKVVKGSNAASFQLFDNRMLGWPMTYTVVCSK
jgi:2-polyprenyl-3-methyl-5-hydroxy-6-metoxy-1,4-benzoquinol methylase